MIHGTCPSHPARDTRPELAREVAINLSPEGTMMSVDVRPGSVLDLGRPRPLFRTRLRPNGAVDQYAVTADGQRFIIMEPPVDATPDALTIVTNGTTLLKK